MTSGVVYVLINPGMPGMVKIGKTTRTSEERARELRTTGVAHPFLVVWDELVTDVAAVERLAHQDLAAHRVDSRREFFYASPKVAIRTLQRAADSYRVASPLRGQVADVKAEFLAKFGDILRHELMTVEVVVASDAVWLRTTERNAAGDIITTDMDLGFIADDDEPWFSVEESAEYNVQRLLELDEYSLIMTTRLIRDEEALRIDKEFRQAAPGSFAAPGNASASGHPTI